MQLPLTALLLVAFVTATYAIYVYNHLVMVRANVAKAWSNIGVLLKQRNGELPQLVAVCREYMRYEQDMFERLARARTAAVCASDGGDVRQVGDAEAALQGSLTALFARAESYPTLKAENRFADLAKRIAALEAGIADRRSFYNESVCIHNVAIESFPQSLLANAFGFRRAQPLVFDSKELNERSFGLNRG